MDLCTLHPTCFLKLFMIPIILDRNLYSSLDAIFFSLFFLRPEGLSQDEEAIPSLSQSHNNGQQHTQPGGGEAGNHKPQQPQTAANLIVKIKVISPLHKGSCVTKFEYKFLLAKLLANQYECLPKENRQFTSLSQYRTAWSMQLWRAKDYCNVYYKRQGATYTDLH